MYPSGAGRPKRPSTIFPAAAFDIDEIVIGQLLGSGTYCDVHEIKAFRQRHCFRQEINEEQGYARDFMARQAQTRRFEESTYVIKLVSQHCDDHAYATAALVAEVEILSNIEHPNIIKVRGFALRSETDRNAEYNARNQFSFLVMDRILETLNDRVEAWRKRNERLTHPALKSIIDKSGLKRRHLFLDRLQAITDLANALEFLHVQNILHGDIEPGSIGFDCKGNLKLFDFNRARKIDYTTAEPEYAVDNRTYNVEKLPYMSPEVFVGETERKGSDVYSFAIVFHHILTMDKPFSWWITQDNFHLQVVQKEERPLIDNSWPSSVQHILRLAWDPNVDGRPNMLHIRKVLDEELRVARVNRLSMDIESILRQRYQPNAADQPSDTGSARKALTKLCFDSSLHMGSLHMASSIHSRTKFSSKDV